MSLNFLLECSSSSGSEYASPDVNPDETNYSLEYTHSRGHPVRTRTTPLTGNRRSPRISQVRGRASDSQRSIINDERRSVPSSPAGPSQRSQPTRGGNQTPRRGNAQPATRSQPPTRRRKQRRPLSTQQREQKFYLNCIKLQNQTTNLIPRLPFSRLLREILMFTSNVVDRITPQALEALQEASEMYLTQQFADAYMLTIHRGRVTLMPKDMELVRLLHSKT